MPLCGGAKSDAKVWWPLSSQNVYVLAITSLASEYLPTGLGAQLALPTLVSSGMELVGEAGACGRGCVAGGGGGGVVDDVDSLDDVGRLDEDADDVVPDVLRT